MGSKADRPYGVFPRGGLPEEPASAPAPARRRWYEPDPSPRAAFIRRGAFVASLLLLGLALRAPGPPPTIVEAPQPSASPTTSDLFAAVRPSVVEVRATVAATNETRTGAGVLVDQSGAILTALHVVDGARLSVRFVDGTTVPAAIAAVLAEQDVAVIIPSMLPQGIRPAVMGNPQSLRVGDQAFAIGSPFGLTGSLSVGVVSGLQRSALVPPLEKSLDGLIQFDGAINPGNSGGPLFDENGEVVGIVVGVPQPDDGKKTADGIGFAVTIQNAAGALGLPPD
jgi:S1-C subfamily serine protease